MQQGDFINVFLALHVSGTYAHNQEHQMLSCSIWFSAPSFWVGAVHPYFRMKYTLLVIHSEYRVFM